MDDAAGTQVNGFHERVEVEPEVLFPLIKSSDFSLPALGLNHEDGGSQAEPAADSNNYQNDNVCPIGRPRRFLLLPQLSPEAEPHELENTCPKAWAYLQRCAELFNKRKRKSM